MGVTMATVAERLPIPAHNDDGFFLQSAIAMAMVIIAGFSLQFVMGRSSFSAPPLVHAHAIVFMGWMVIYVAQNVFVARGNIAMHRKLGWIAAGWMVLMVVLGCLVTVAMVQGGRVPFFFLPQQFLIFDPLTLFGFAGLTAAAIAKRKQTDWHRRLHFGAMTILVGPAFGRLLPAPFLIPWVFDATFANRGRGAPTVRQGLTARALSPPLTGSAAALSRTRTASCSCLSPPPSPHPHLLLWIS
jgi:hypothetical protein